MGTTGHWFIGSRRRRLRAQSVAAWMAPVAATPALQPLVIQAPRANPSFHAEPRR